MTELVIKNLKGEYLAIDQASGGYPFFVKNLNQAKVWQSRQDASDYYKHWPEEKWSLHEVIVKTEQIGWG